MKERRETSPPDIIFSPTTPSVVTSFSRMVWYFVKLVLKLVRLAEAVLLHLASCWDRKNKSLLSSSSNILHTLVRRSVFLYCNSGRSLASLLSSTNPPDSTKAAIFSGIEGGGGNLLREGVTRRSCCVDPASVPASDLLPLSAPSVGLRSTEDVSQKYQILATFSKKAFKYN